MVKARFPTLYNELLAQRRHTFGTNNTEESLTQQSDAKDADINVLMSRYRQTGLLPQQQRAALSGDFTDVGDFREAQEKVKAAREAFDAVPSNVRKRFHNNPQELVEFLKDPENREEAIKLGLVEKPPKQENPTPPIPAEETEINRYGQRSQRYGDEGPVVDDDRPRDQGRQGVPKGEPPRNGPPTGDRGRTGR